jgi:hypothetical protein
MKKLITLMLLLTLTSCMKTKTVNGVINRHTIEVNPFNQVAYLTVIVCDDGQIRNNTTLDYYVLPIGKKIKLTVKQ